MDDNDDENDEEEEVIDDEHNNINIDDGDDMRMVSMHHGRAKTTILEKLNASMVHIYIFLKRKEMRETRNTFELV
jgi:hypothetical protein